VGTLLNADASIIPAAPVAAGAALELMEGWSLAQAANGWGRGGVPGPAASHRRRSKATEQHRQVRHLGREAQEVWGLASRFTGGAGSSSSRPIKGKQLVVLQQGKMNCPTRGLAGDTQGLGQHDLL